MTLISGNMKEKFVKIKIQKRKTRKWIKKEQRQSKYDECQWKGYLKQKKRPSTSASTDELEVRTH